MIFCVCSYFPWVYLLITFSQKKTAPVFSGICIISQLPENRRKICSATWPPTPFLWYFEMIKNSAIFQSTSGIVPTLLINTKPASSWSTFFAYWDRQGDRNDAKLNNWEGEPSSIGFSWKASKDGDGSLL